MAATLPPRVLASTTSHKREPLLPTLQLFSRLDLCDIDLNLHRLMEEGESVDAIVDAAAEYDLRIWVVSGGWCDFFHGGIRAQETDRSVARQVEIGRRLGAAALRLFFGRLKEEEYSTVRLSASARAARSGETSPKPGEGGKPDTTSTPTPLETICENLRRLSDRHPNMRFNFENHDGASLNPKICREILEKVDRPNIRMNFDPINFERADVNSLDALEAVHARIGHVHLKGLSRGEFCAFGEGDVDLSPVLKALASHGYRGGFSVEYEGPDDATERLHKSVIRARSAVAELT